MFIDWWKSRPSICIVLYPIQPLFLGLLVASKEKQMWSYINKMENKFIGKMQGWWLREPRVGSETRKCVARGHLSGALLPPASCQKPHLPSSLSPEVGFLPPPDWLCLLLLTWSLLNQWPEQRPVFLCPPTGSWTCIWWAWVEKGCRLGYLGLCVST